MQGEGGGLIPKAAGPYDHFGNNANDTKLYFGKLLGRWVKFDLSIRLTTIIKRGVVGRIFVSF